MLLSILYVILFLYLIVLIVDTVNIDIVHPLLLRSCYNYKQHWIVHVMYEWI